MDTPRDLGAYVPEGWNEAAAGATALVAEVLASLGYADVFCDPPAAWRCAEPIVLRCGAWRRLTRLDDGRERGERDIEVIVCREDPRNAEAVALSAERDLRRDGWTGLGSGWHCRVAARDTSAPEPRGRDSSGRWTWAFTCTLTVVRDL